MARAIVCAVSQPQHVAVDELVLRPTQEVAPEGCRHGVSDVNA